MDFSQNIEIGNFQISPSERNKLIALGAISVFLALGFLGVILWRKRQNTVSSFAKIPDFKPLTASETKSKFGTIQYRLNAINDGSFTITNGWDAKNLVSVDIPQLKKNGISKTGMVTFNRKAAKQLQALWKEWDEKGLLKYINSFDGAFNPRLIRGSSQNISMHAYGLAFDINASTNKLGFPAAQIGEKGTVIPLVEIANKHGFFWGGHFGSRKDAMHFEIATLKS